MVAAAYHHVCGQADDKKQVEIVFFWGGPVVSKYQTCSQYGGTLVGPEGSIHLASRYSVCEAVTTCLSIMHLL